MISSWILLFFSVLVCFFVLFIKVPDFLVMSQKESQLSLKRRKKKPKTAHMLTAAVAAEKSWKTRKSQVSKPVRSNRNTHEHTCWYGIFKPACLCLSCSRTESNDFEHLGTCGWQDSMYFFQYLQASKSTGFNCGQPYYFFFFTSQY